jgi:DNA repair exonuclease SbcCD ATPase subunit
MESLQDACSSFPFSLNCLFTIWLRMLSQPDIRSSEKMKQVVIFTCVVALVFPLALAGCCRVEMASLQDELQRTRTERNDLKAKLEAAVKTRPRSQTQEPVLGISGSLNEFQKQIDAFVSFREELQKREDELARLRQAALAEAKTAQERMDKLGDQLKAETERVIQLQSQLKEAQSAIVELQDKLKE